MTLDREMQLARTIAREAGRLILEVYATRFDVVEKEAGAGPVTEADKRANDYIVGELRKAFPKDGVIAEEAKDNSQESGFERCWFIDPLDGTKEFVNRNGEFAVHIGLAIDGVATLGVVHKPVDGKQYFGTVDGGSFLEFDGHVRPMQVSQTADTSQLRLVVSRSHRSPEVDRIAALLGTNRLIESGSVGLKCGLLAEGVADLYIHPSPKSSRWDSCAPEAVLRGAGGQLVDVFGERYNYDGREILNTNGLIGCNTAAYERVMEAVRKIVLPPKA
jgi:3'(2'), 5'-bisphosphate nucleotidase